MDKENKEIFISYIVPCYNVQKYLPNCLKSLAKQRINEGAGIEYILVNDGSNDDTLRLLNEFAATDERATVIDQENQGVCAARNNGLKVARGQYVYFHDGDDILTDEASQLIYNESRKKESDIIIPNAYIVDENDLENKREWNTCPGFEAGVYTTVDFVSKINKLPISVKVYKREPLVTHHILFDEDLKVGEVYTFFFHALAFSKYVTLTGGRMMNWVVRSGGTTRGYNIERDSLIIDTMHRIHRYADDFTFDVKSKESYHVSLFGIVNTFSMNKYLVLDYTTEIGCFLNKIKNDMVYKESLNFFLFKKPQLGMKYLNLAIMYFLPIKVYYLKRQLRIRSRIKNLLRHKCKG